MAYSWGAYWTHYTPENAYVDALLLGSWYDIDAKSNRMDKLKTDGGAFGASLEGGYPVYTGLGGFSIEPQAQLAYQTVNLNNGSDVWRAGALRQRQLARWTCGRSFRAGLRRTDLADRSPVHLHRMDTSELLVAGFQRQ
ncbi:autotransporter domain-containing protein [Hyphomicrobium sulfonivorans]|uniref:autotransporter domain-containing protein n=1 Tax=Hyphomicrobium sulfonivorans TaxID=121290 RepID=UPI003B845156